MIQISCWFRLPFFGLLLDFVGLLGLSLNFVTFFGHSLKCLDSNQLMTKAASRGLESIQLMTHAAFQELTQNQLMTQVDSQVLIQIDSWLKVLPHFFDSNQLMNQAKSIWLWVDSWFDWVIPMSDTHSPGTDHYTAQQDHRTLPFTLTHWQLTA